MLLDTILWRLANLFCAKTGEGDFCKGNALPKSSPDPSLCLLICFSLSPKWVILDNRRLCLEA